MTTTYLNVKTESQLSADIKAIDLASQKDGGDGTVYSITFEKGATLTGSADISAINLTGADTLTINGLGARLDGAGAYQGLFAYSGATTIEEFSRSRTASPRAAPAARGASAASAAAVAAPVAAAVGTREE